MKEIALSGLTPLAELADMMEVSSASIISKAFHGHGRMLTVREQLSFELARAIAANFGYTVIRRGE